jgi:hypothetical protein
MGKYLKENIKAIGSCEILLDNKLPLERLQELPDNTKNTLLELDNQHEQIKCALEELKEKKGYPQ